ncbi:MAG: glutamate--cysteine ligase, partial [Alphaproteobacteria bacterium]|nr:glutamate--cysteine ligase [Alphaproteobacteria bacterium]
AMRDAVPKLGFKTPFRNTSVLELARQMLEISAAGLKRRAAEDSAGMTEEGFLMPLRELVTRGYTRAEELLMRYNGEWKGDMRPLFTEYNFL